MTLDKPQTYQQLDPSGMHGRIAGLPQQCRQAWREATSLHLPGDYRRVRRIVVTGMGGSAIGGDLIADLLSLEEGLPIVTSREYRLPAWVDQETLVIASSYSGDTEETLSAFQEALHRGARIVAITTGGRLKAEAEAGGIPVLAVGYTGEPRTALGYSFIAPLGLLNSLGLMQDKSGQVGEALDALEQAVARWNRDRPLEENQAKQLAQELHQRLVVIYGAGIISGVARRWKTQLNENAKAWAFAESLPEVDHNSVVGYSFPDTVREGAFAVLLDSSYSHARTNQRYQVTQEVLARAGVRHRLIESSGSSPLAQMLTAVLLGDFTSYYLALLNGVDPSPVKAIDYLKQRLAQM